MWLAATISRLQVKQITSILWVGLRQSVDALKNKDWAFLNQGKYFSRMKHRNLAWVSRLLGFPMDFRLKTAASALTWMSSQPPVMPTDFHLPRMYNLLIQSLKIYRWQIHYEQIERCIVKIFIYLYTSQIDSSGSVSLENLTNIPLAILCALMINFHW